MTPEQVLMKARDTERWWAFGSYNGEDCGMCVRQRVMICEDPKAGPIRLCEKCNWSPDRNDYVTEAIA